MVGSTFPCIVGRQAVTAWPGGQGELGFRASAQLRTDSVVGEGMETLKTATGRPHRVKRTGYVEKLE